MAVLQDASFPSLSSWRLCNRKKLNIKKCNPQWHDMSWIMRIWKTMGAYTQITPKYPLITFVISCEYPGVGAASRRAWATPHHRGKGLILSSGVDDGSISIQRQEYEAVFMTFFLFPFSPHYICSLCSSSTAPIKFECHAIHVMVSFSFLFVRWFSFDSRSARSWPVSDIGSCTSMSRDKTAFLDSWFFSRKASSETRLFRVGLEFHCV